jgi:hypothetical protein
MWHDIKKLIWLAWHNALVAGSSTGISVFWLGFGVLGLSFVFSTAWEWGRSGRNILALRQALKSWVSYAVPGTALAVAWCILFGYYVMKTIYDDHQYLASDKLFLSQEVVRWRGIAERRSPDPSVAQSTVPRAIIKRKQTVSPPTPDVGKFVVTQTSMPTTRPDAPNHLRVVVQTTIDFPSLRFALKCSQPIIDAQGGVGPDRNEMMSRREIDPKDRTVWTYQYGSSRPSFGPANPLTIDVWSAVPNDCRNASTF